MLEGKIEFTKYVMLIKQLFFCIMPVLLNLFSKSEHLIVKIFINLYWNNVVP